MGAVRENVLYHVMVSKPLWVDEDLIAVVFWAGLEHVEELVDCDWGLPELIKEHLVPKQKRIVVENGLVAAHLVSVVKLA